MSEKKSVAQERKINCYPSPAQIQKLEAYAKTTGQSKSSIVCDAISLYLKDKNISASKKE